MHCQRQPRKEVVEGSKGRHQTCLMSRSLRSAAWSHWPYTNPMRRLGLVLFSAMFVYGGWGQASQPVHRAEQGRNSGLPVTDDLVRASGVAMILGGVALQLPALRRLAAAALALQLAMVSYIGHRYWEHEPGPQRSANQINFYKNVSLLGGLLYIASERS